MFGALRRYLPWLATSIVALTLIFSNQNPQIESLGAGIIDMVTLGTAPISWLLKAPQVWKENRRLRRMLVDLSQEVAGLGERSAENRRLREMLSFMEQSEYEMLAAEVVGMNPDPGVRGLLVNRGSGDGVTGNMAVIVPEGVVGRVYRTGVSSAAVQLLIDPNLGVAGRLRKGREDGIVHASGGRRLRLDGIPVTADVATGDSVVTSGLGGIFPPNLFIGVTTRVAPAPDGWLLEVEVAPGVDFSRIEELFIVKGVGSAE